MKFTFSEIEALAEATHGQRQNNRWYMERVGRILGTSMRYRIELGHELLEQTSNIRSKLPAELLDKIRFRRRCLYNYKDFSSRPAVSWGLEKESLARACYEKQTGYRVKQTGLWIFPSGAVCCSPDGMVFTSQGSKRPDGILEIKCPYKLRNNQYHTRGTSPKYFPYLKSDFEIDETHRLYHTIQAELYATRTKWCDLFVWTPSQTNLVRVERNEAWIQANISLVDWVFLNYIYPLCRKGDRKKYRCRELQKRDWHYREEVYPNRKAKR